MKDLAEHLEQWRWVLGWEGKYAIHQSGTVWDVGTGRILRKSRNLDGYVTSKVAGENRYIHSMLLEAFVGPRPKGHDARHLNDIPWDNRLGNLAWGTRSENMQDAKRNRRLLGQQANSPLSFDLADQIRAYRTYGFKYKELAEMFGVREHSIGYVCRGEAWMRGRAS